MPYNKSENKGKKSTETATPLWLCDFLYDLLKVNDYKIILDCAAGDKRLTNNFKNSTIINYEIKDGSDFLLETNKIICNLCIMNPPFNLYGQGKKLAVEVFLDKVFELIDHKIPVICIVPMGLRLNQRINSERWQKMKEIYPEITTIITLPINTFENTLYHSEIICFNTNFLKPHYFIDKQYIKKYT
jgi:hypothetical protein